MIQITGWVKTFLIAFLLTSFWFYTAKAASTLAFSDTFSSGIPKEYRAKGDVTGRNGLRFKDASAVFRKVDGHGEISLDFTLDTPTITKGDPKFQAQIYIGDLPPENSAMRR